MLTRMKKPISIASALIAVFALSVVVMASTVTYYGTLDGEIEDGGPVPASLDHGLHQSSSVQVFSENPNVTVGVMTDDRGLSFGPGNYASYILHFDNNGSLDAFAAGSIEFHDDIVGIYHTNTGLASTDSIFGVAGVDYTQPYRRTGYPEPHDTFTVVDDTITFDLKVDIGIDQIRVIVSDADSDGDGVLDSLDCDDLDPTIFPGAIETAYDGIDQDCNGSDLTDVDGDGVDGGPLGTDCDDEDSERFPGNTEIAYDTIDQDCDGSDLTDVDGDGVDGGPLGTDCDDEDPARYPGNTEIAYDGIDQDCDGSDLTDVDGDTFAGGDGGADCDDTDPNTYPGAPEIRDGKDNDCDGDVDEGLNKRAILVGSGVPGKGLATAPGLEGYFNPKSKAADKAGKKK